MDGMFLPILIAIVVILLVVSISQVVKAALDPTKRKLKERLSTEGTRGSIASKMLLFDKRDHIHTVGDYFTREGRAGNRGVWQADEGQLPSQPHRTGKPSKLFKVSSTIDVFTCCTESCGKSTSLTKRDSPDSPRVATFRW